MRFTLFPNPKPDPKPIQAAPSEFQVLSTLVSLLQKDGNRDFRGEPSKALGSILEKEASGADSPKAAAHLRRLGTAYQRQGKMEAAGLALKEAESILESAHGSKHPEVQPAPASASTSSLPASAHACADPLPMLALISSRSTAGEGVEAAAARRTLAFAVRAAAWGWCYWTWCRRGPAWCVCGVTGEGLWAVSRQTN